MRTKFGELMIVKEKPQGQQQNGGGGANGDQKNHKSRYHGGNVAKKTLKAKITQNNTRRLDLVEPGGDKLARAAEQYANRPLGRDKSAVFSRRHT